MPQRTVTFETKCWDKDWRFLLTTNYLEKNIAHQQFPFTRRVIFINNVRDTQAVTTAADRIKSQGVIDDYYVVEQYADEALRFFQIPKESFGRGYYYSIAELVSLYLCSTEYILHFAGDTYMPQPSDWVTPALDILERRPDIVIANPTWNNNYLGAEQESTSQDNDFFYGYGFSDQCYLVRTRDFRQPIYMEKNNASERYPEYGGELFEKRVDAWMRNHQHLRATYRHNSYIHQNFPHLWWQKKLALRKWGVLNEAQSAVTATHRIV